MLFDSCILFIGVADQPYGSTAQHSSRINISDKGAIVI